MASNTADERSLLQVWTEYLRNILGTWPAGQEDFPAASGNGEEDQWLTLINRLWQANPCSKLIPLDPGNITSTFQQMWLDAVRNPGHALTNYADFVQSYTRLMSATALRISGHAPDPAPVAAPDKADRRFSAREWQQNAAFDAIKQAYLLAATAMLKNASEIEGLDERRQRKLIFYLRQYLDAMSPSNFALTNPEVIREAVATGGASLVKGIENFQRDLADGQLRQTNMEAFALGHNIAVTPGQVVYRNKLIELLQYTPQTEQVHATPLIFVPNWINKYYIIDMQPENSLVRYLVAQGFTVFVISWKNPDASMEDVSFDDYMELGPLAAFQVAKEITGAPKVNAVGYCIGGTLLAMTLAYLAAKGQELVDAATFFVSLLDFSEVGDTAVFIDEPTVAHLEDQMAQHGYLDSKNLSLMFNLLRANDLIWTCVVNNYLLGKDAPDFDLLYWNADGTRMTRAAHSFYLRNTYLENNLIKPGKVVMKGVPIDLKAIRQDSYAVGSELDHLVPWRTAWQISKLTSGKTRFVVGGSGHIAGVINPPTKGRGYWVNDSDRPAASADQWFAGTEHHKGSWWPDWVAWLRPRSGEQVAPPPMRGKKYKPIMPAPGSYVIEK